MARPFGPLARFFLTRSARGQGTCPLKGNAPDPTRTQGVPMRFSSRFTSSALSFAPLALALLVLGLGGACEDKHIGRKCELGVEQDGGVSGTTATISSPALE